MTAIDEIKARLNIVDLVSETVKLRRAGKNYTGFCPFHPNTRTPAFVVFPDSGTWRCFGQCNEGGDIFKYVMKKEGWDFPETLRHLASRAGVTLEPLTPERQVEDEQHAHLRALLEDAVTFYRHQLLQTPAGEPALAYLKKRGLTPETLETFGLGYAPDSWDSALRHFSQKGYSPQELLDAGLATERQSGGGVYDRFRNRIMFPIRDMTGKMTGFGARILNPDDVPKFLNSPQTALFDKGRLLYGLDQARKSIRTQDQVVIVEGYLDVIVLHQGGFTNTVSPMGTALNEDQLRMLKRFTRRMVLALDADAAGEKATLRGLEIARQALDRSEEMGFDARGLLRHEARLDADVRVTTIPEGMDPDEVVLRNPEEWAQILSAARPIVVHVMETLAANHNLDDPKVKGEIAQQVLPLIEDVPDPVERDAYRQRLARLIKVDERALLGEKAAPRARRKPSLNRPPSRTRPEAVEPGGSKQVQAMELHCLKLLVRRPEAIYPIDRMLQQAGLLRFSPQDFDHTDHQLLARLLMEAQEQDQLDPSQYLTAQLPANLEPLLEALRAPLGEKEPSVERLQEDLLRTLINLRLLRIQEGLQQMRYMQQDAPEQDSTLFPYQDLILQYTAARGKLEQVLSKPVQFD